VKPAGRVALITGSNIGRASRPRPAGEGAPIAAVADRRDRFGPDTPVRIGRAPSETVG